jgi:hypothetical protein
MIKRYDIRPRRKRNVGGGSDGPSSEPESEADPAKLVTG